MAVKHWFARKVGPAVKPREPRALAERRGSNGFAIIFVLVFMALALTITGDILYQTQIVAKNAMSGDNRMQAQGTALTGMSIAQMLIKFHTLATSTEAKNIPFTLPETLYSSLNGIPIGKETLVNNDMFNELIDENVLNELKKIPGSFTLHVTSENCKFNLNLFRPGPFSEYAKNALLNLFSTPDAKSVLQIYNLNGADLVSNLSLYFQQINRSLISVSELRLVDGFQYDDIYNMYAPYFTVWPSSELIKSSINANCVPVELIASILRPSEQEAINQIVWQKFESYRSESTFADVRNLTNWFENNAGTWTNVNVKNTLKLFSTKDDVFRIESTGAMNKVIQKLTVVTRIDESGKFVTDYTQWSSR